MCYDSLGRCNESLAFYEKCKEIREEMLSPNHPELGKIYNNIGICYDELGKNEEALVYYEKSKEI